MNGLLQDVHYALRQFRKSPGFSATAIGILALGIGANTAIFSVIEAVMLRSLPYAHPKRLVMLSDAQDPSNAGFLLKDITSIRSRTRSFSDIAFYYRDSGFSNVTLTGGTEPQSVQGAFVTSNLFSLTGVAPVAGRTFTTDEENHHDRVVILSHRLWARQFGLSPNAIGSFLHINGEVFQIIGVMPAIFEFPARDQEFWAPITTDRYWDDPSIAKIDPSHSRYSYERWQAIGRLRDRVPLTQAQAEIDSLFSQMSLSDPDPNRGSRITVTPLRTVLDGNTRTALAVLSLAVFLVLLISCCNVANLMLARSAVREREIAIRAALGAGRSRLMRQLLTESALLAFLSGISGLALASIATHLLIAKGPFDIPRIEQTRVDSVVLAFTTAICVLVSIGIGLAPGWRLSQTNESHSLRTGSGGGSTLRTRTRSALVVSEFALALVLLAGAGILIRSFLALRDVDPGFQPQNVLTMKAWLPAATDQQRDAFYVQGLERVRNLPGVIAAGEVDSLFELDTVSNLGLRAIEGRSPEPKERWTPLGWVSVRGDYFKAMGTRLLRGRYFNSEDRANSSLVAIIDESMARRYWPNQEAIGQRFKGQDTRGKNDDWITVVGVVRDMRRSGLERNPIPHVFVPSTQEIDGTRTAYLVVRITTDSHFAAEDFRSCVRSLSTTAILSPVTTLEQELDQQLAPRRFQTSLLGTFSAVALVLAALGIFAIMHYGVAQRTREIGVRAAMGARPIDVVRLVLTEATRLALQGVVIGLGLALLLTRFMQSLLFGVHSIDPVIFVVAPLLLLVVAVLASCIPARRAAKVDPMVALRYE